MSVNVNENPPSEFPYRSLFTIVGIDNSMPNPINRKLCAIVAKTYIIFYFNSISKKKKILKY